MKVRSLPPSSEIILERDNTQSVAPFSKNVPPQWAMLSGVKQVMPSLKAIPTSTSTANLKAGGFHDKDIFNPVHFYSMFLQHGRLGDASQITSNDIITLRIDVVSWGQLTVDIKAGAALFELKQLIEQNIKIVPADQEITFNKSKLTSDNRSLMSYGIGDGEHIELLCSGHNSYFLIPVVRFDPKGDFDYSGFTAPPDFGNRGGETYIPPAGWRRYGLKVEGLYENDVWLGRDNRPGEWIVSYHGTGVQNIKSIIDQGFDQGKQQRDLYGKGIYSAPNADVAELYAKEITWEGRRFKMLFMNRVNPATVQRFDDPHGLYFLSASDRDIRPYELLIKEIK